MLLKSYSRCMIRRCCQGRLPRYSVRSDRCYHELSYAEPARRLDYYVAPSKQSEESWVAPWGGATRWAQVKMIAAPWNPADLLSVHGVYPSPWERAEDPDGAFAEAIRFSAFEEGKIVAGSEGWGRVVKVYPDKEDSGTKVYVEPPSSSLKVGDFVVPGVSGLGTLRSSLWAPESHWIRLDRGQELFDALGPFTPAALFQTGGTAWRMLHDFFKLDSRGDVVVQNAGNSAVGFMVSQIAAAILNVPCISLIRKGNRTPTQVQQLQDYLKERGKATLVLPEESITKNSVAKLFESMESQHRHTIIDADTFEERPLSVRLALNAVGGSSVNKLLLFLNNHGTVVTYGGMSREPITVDTSEFIFRNIDLAGYWHSRWMVQQHRQQEEQRRTNSSAMEDARVTMMTALVNAVLEQRLECPPVQSFTLRDFQMALGASSEMATIRQKVVFDCQEDKPQSAPRKPSTKKK